jgi:ankyrin repeat protein
MKWLLCARSQLTTSKFIAAISVDFSGQCTNTSKADILSICCNLVVHDSEQDTFRFAHLSVREYLESLPEYSTLSVHTFALERCLNAYLELSNLSPASRSNNRLFNAYARNRWSEHHDEVHKGSKSLQLSQGLRKNLLDFFFNNYDKDPSFARWVLHSYNTEPLSQSGNMSALSCLVGKDLAADRQQIENAASTSDPKNSEILVNFMLADLMFVSRLVFEHPLPLAVRERNDAVRLMLLSKGASINACDKQGKSALSFAIEYKDEGLLFDILERGAGLHNRDYLGVSELYRASEFGYERAVRELLQRGVPVDTRNDDGSTPLMGAGTHCQTAIVQLLLETGADVNATSRLHESTLLKVASKGHTTVSRVLLDNGANIDFLDYRQRTALHNAAETGVEDLMELLLERGAQKAKMDMYGHTPTDIAAANGHIAIMKFFLRREENPEARVESARKALLRAADEGHYEVVKFLVESEVDLRACMSPADLIDRADQCLLDKLETFQILLAYWTSIDALDVTGQTLLHHAAKHGRGPLIRQGHLARMLLQNQANTEVRNFRGETPLHVAAAEGNKDVVRHLLDAKADLKASTPVSGYTALHKAAEAGHLDIVKILMEAGADVNAELSDGQTALHLAAAKEHDSIFLYLMDFM